MENTNQHKDTFLAKWIAGELSDKELKTLVGEKEYFGYLKLKEALIVNDHLNAPLDASYAKIQEKISQNKKKVIPLNIKWAVGIAASILVAFVVFNFLNPGQTVISTDFGEHESFVLKDGSEVILNSKSSITYTKDDWENNRELFLDGEAYFKVAKGKTFSVKTSNGTVQVLGTEFNVNSTKDFFDVTCYEGKVKVTTNDEMAYILLPTNKVRKINGDDTQNLNSSTFQPSWISGESTFKSVPLTYVIVALEKEYNISIDNSGVDSSLLFSGAFPHNNLDIALQTVFSTLNISYDYTTKSNLMLSNSK